MSDIVPPLISRGKKGIVEPAGVSVCQIIKKGLAAAGLFLLPLFLVSAANVLERVANGRPLLSIGQSLPPLLVFLLTEKAEKDIFKAWKRFVAAVSKIIVCRRLSCLPLFFCIL